MRHVEKFENGTFTGDPVCGDPNFHMPLNEDSLVYAAMESDCDACRVKLMVQPIEWSKPDKDGMRRPLNISPGVAPYEPTPYLGAETALADLKKFRDGT